MSPWITHERLDDEVMAVNLESGAYIALDDAAADCWTLLVSGASIDQVAGTLVERYTVDPTTARGDAEAFVAAIVDARLMIPRPDGERAPTFSNPLPPVNERRAYEPPTVQVFDDLEDLLRLDPVHEVDEFGWPVARRD